MTDGTAMPAAIVSELVTMDTASQATRLIAKVGSAPFLPEGLNATAEFREQTKREGMLIPREAVQSDEKLSGHWIMKVEDDSIAVRVPVKVIGSDASRVEVEGGSVRKEDRIILTGGYGLEDGAKVEVVEDSAAMAQDKSENQ